MTLPPVTLLTVPIYNFVNEHEQTKNDTEQYYYPCCGKRAFAKGVFIPPLWLEALRSVRFCNSDRGSKT
jgi:hypothetical protein